MTKPVRCSTAIMLAIALADPMAFMPDAHAADKYPLRPIRIIHGFSAGGVSDTLARVIGDKLGERFGQPIIVEARPGGGGIVGMTAAIEATPDGYTLLIGSSAITVSPNRKDKPRFDPMQMFVPVSMIGTSPSILLANPSAPFKSVKELIAYARTRPDEVNCATSGIGTTNDLGVHLLNSMVGIKIMPIPYKGSGPSLNAALGNETPLSFAPLLPSVPHVQQKRLRPLGVSGLKRNHAVPDVPTIAEVVPGYDNVGFFSIVAYREVPKQVIGLLHKEINAVLALPDIQKNLTRLGVDVEIMTIPQIGEYIQSDAKKWADLVRKAGLVF
ncbi:MAG: tripartite tricarboxylate transporter substrate binding protein [Betaproteobacteria bacterium]|nr:tripartite tricarboxylate transporter substrate binding protein [Betaproteobacteria bacterium]